VSVAETETETETEVDDDTGDDETEVDDDTGDDETAPVAPPAPVEPPPSAVDEASMEKFFKGLTTRTATLDRWIEAELGENYADLSACPLCSDAIVGHIYPPEWVTPASELQGRLLEVLKTPSAPEYRDAPNVRQCGTCAGWGSVLSGSRVAGKERVMCPTCKGNGFQGEVALSNPPQPVNGEVVFELPADTEPLVSADADIWGSPRVLDDGQDNPNYGKMPQYKNPALP
jgi:hypothetical protein